MDRELAIGNIDDVCRHAATSAGCVGPSEGWRYACNTLVDGPVNCSGISSPGSNC